MGEFNWQQIAARAAEGDKDAFEMLYKQTERSVYFTCLKLLGNEHDAKDVMQDTYITAFDKLSDLSDYSNIPAWINRIAVNNCKMLFRKQHIDYLDDQPENTEQIVDDREIIPSDYVSNAEKRRIIMNIIDTQLSDIQRQTIVLYYYDEMSVADIAEIMECPEGTVKYRLSAAREKIREAVLIYEKENDDKLHAIAPIPVLTSILRKEAEEIAVPKIQLFRAEASVSQQSPGKNIGDKLNKGGTSAMTKALQGKMIAGAAAVVVVGGGITAAVALNRNNEPNISEKDSYISENDSYIIEQDSDSNNMGPVPTDINDSETDSNFEASSAADIEDSKPEDEGRYLDWFGVNYYLPPYFEAAHKDVGMNIWRKELESGIDVYLCLDMQIAYGPNNGTDTYDVEDVPEILNEDIVKGIGVFYSLDQSSEFVIETNDEKEVLGETFMRQTGTVNVRPHGEPTGELYYAAYYGHVDMKGYEKVPLCWITFSDNESTKSELESVEDIFAERMEWVEK